MNRKLQIDIDQNEQGDEEGQEMEERYDEAGLEQYEEESAQKYDHQDEDGSEQLQIDSKEGRFQTIENVQNFGQEKDHSHLLRQFVNSSKPKHRRTTELYKLLETPIEIYNKQEQITTKNRLEQSSIDEEINRIVNKVMNKKSVMSSSPLPKNLYDLKEVKKIDVINKELLSQNTKLISQINQFERQLTALKKKVLSRPKKEENKNKTQQSCDDRDLFKTMRRYKERLAKAINLNSKLSSRLNTEKSRSRVISSIYPSKVTKRDDFTYQIQVTSMEKSNVLKELRKSKLRKQSNFSGNSSKANHIYCQKCCNEIKPNLKSSPQQEGSKQLKLSPVLQFKNYEIEGEKIMNFNSFQLGQIQSLKRQHKDVECQVSLDQTKYIQQIEACTKQQIELERVIKENNERLRNFEESLYRLVDNH